MEEALLAIERFPPTAALRSSFIAYPLVSAAHILSFGVLVTSVILMDLRILGAMALERGPFVALMRRAAMIGFTLAVLTGAALFSIRASEYAFNPAFQVKLGLLLAAGANLALFARQRQPAPGEPYSRPARLLAVLSIMVWTGVLLAGRFIGFL